MFRQSTKASIMEAGMRRAPSMQVAVDAARVAVEEGWNGTSNTAALMLYQVEITCELSMIFVVYLLSFVFPLNFSHTFHIITK